MMTSLEAEHSRDQLARELDNFQEIASHIKPGPGDVPTLAGFDIYGESLPLNGVVGGDHIIYLDFKRRYDLDARIQQATEAGRPDIVENLKSCRHKAGIALVDVSGHKVTDALLAAMFHQAFLLGSIYEMDISGGISSRLFENLNTRFYNSSSVNKYLTMLYAEITEPASFRFLSAAHHAPLVFSNLKDRFMEVSEDLRATSSPVGTLPSRNVIDHNTTGKSALGFKGRYEWNEWVLMGHGDILLLSTDGLIEHGSDDDPYVPNRLERRLREVKCGTAKEIFDAIRQDLMSFAEPSDDISIVVIKRM